MRQKTLLAIEMLNNGYCKDINDKITKNIEEVVKIDLYNKNISEIPKELYLFKNLVQLELGNNEIELIENIDRLNKLEILNLGFNEIKQISGLGNNKSLKKLYLHNNFIYKIGDNSIRNQIELEYLNIKGNKIDNLNGMETNNNLKEFYFDEDLLLNLKIEEVKEFFNNKKHFEQSTYNNILMHIIKLNRTELSDVKNYLFDFIDFSKTDKIKIPYIIKIYEEDFLNKAKNDDVYLKKLENHLTNYLSSLSYGNQENKNQQIKNSVEKTTENIKEKLESHDFVKSTETNEYNQNYN